MSEIVFDGPEYMRSNAVREEWLKKVLDKLPFRPHIAEALDLGCGAGYFSKVLWDLGMRVFLVRCTLCVRYRRPARA
jgi:hypothetical protein